MSDDPAVIQIINDIELSEDDRALAIKIINDIELSEYEFINPKGLIQTINGSATPSVRKTIVFKGGVPRRYPTLGKDGATHREETDRRSIPYRRVFFNNLWKNLLILYNPAIVGYDVYTKFENRDKTRMNYTFNFHGFIIILRVNTKRHQTAYSIIINIARDIHLTLFYNIYSTIGWDDQCSALHISVINAPRTTYRIYIPWTYIENNRGNHDDDLKFLISIIYKISYYIKSGQTCSGNVEGLLSDNFINLIDVIESKTGRGDVSNKMLELVKKLSTAGRPEPIDYKIYCPAMAAGGTKIISKKLDKYLLKINKKKYELKLLRKNKLKNKVKIIKQNKLLKELKTKIKKEKAKIKKEKAKIKKEKAKIKKEKVKKKKKIALKRK